MTRAGRRTARVLSLTRYSRESCRSPGFGLVPFAVISFLTVITVVVFKRHLFDHWTFPWDFFGPYSTTPAFVAAVTGSGHVPSWSPFVASGFPAEVDPQVGTYFPGWWLLGTLHVSATLRVVTAVQVAHVLFGSLGVLALARVRRLAWQWAAVAAVAYLFFGGFYGESEHAATVRGFAYIPWLLWSLTPPRNVGRWTRLIALPALVWIVASGAYPGQVVSFAIAGTLYMGMALWHGEKAVLRRYRGSLVLAVVSSAAACIVVLLPYLRAEQAHELYRVFQPTASVRAGEALGPIDLLGLYLNNFAWTYDGTVTSWTVGIPMLVGLACVRWQALRRHTPLIICGAVSLALAMTPKIGFIGQAMTAVRPLFPSRFPASDYKAVVAVAMVILAAEAWSELSASRSGIRLRAVLGGCVLIAGTMFVKATYDQPTHELWLVMVVIACTVGLAVVRTSSRFLFCLLVTLVVIDGVRAVHDYRFQGHISPWQVSAVEAAPFRARDRYIRELPKHLAQAPPSRPARTPAAAPLSVAPTGTDQDSSGWLADGYHFADYDPTIERVRWQAEHDPHWSAMLLEPWHGYMFPCAAVGCDEGDVHLPAPATWSPSPKVRTLSYGIQQIVYTIDINRPMLMVENELAVDGWQSNTERVHPINAGLPLRTWRLSPGRYQYTTTYREPGRVLQYVVLIAALAAWLGCVLTLLRKGELIRRSWTGGAAIN
jgi:hypothetical protein